MEASFKIYVHSLENLGMMCWSITMVQFFVSGFISDSLYFNPYTYFQHCYPPVASSSYFHSQVQPQPNFALCQCPVS
jgi:hypothetical protein